jgi:toluene monooxygenase electron transfer component
VQAFIVPGDKTLLEAALDAGVSISFSCCSGGCGACRVNITGHAQNVVLDEPNEVGADDLAKGAVPACLARLRGPIGFSIP